MKKKIKNSFKRSFKIPNAILFIDEIHTIVGAGSVGGSAMDASNILKPMLANGKLRCIGATTFAEYRNDFQKIKALGRRFCKSWCKWAINWRFYFDFRGIKIKIWRISWCKIL